MNNKLKLTLAVLGLITGAAGCYWGIKKINAAVAENEIKRKQELEELNQRKEAFRVDKGIMLEHYTDEFISSLTLDNLRIKDADERAYLYGKCIHLKNGIYESTFEDEELMHNCDHHLGELCEALEKLDEDALESKLVYMHKEDENKAKNWERINAANEKQREHERELEKMREKRKSDLDIYNAKLEIEKAKLEVLAKAMSGAGNKNISSAINIKTELKED